MKKLIVIVGPTAVGKTAAAITVAEKLHTEIISADSRQVFNELNLGVAKPSADELKKVVHHFIGCKSINENFDAGQFGREALALIHHLFEKYNTLVMVGGSGLYIKAVLEGFDEMPTVESGVREKIQLGYKENGIEWLQREVQKIDPDYFSSVDQKNPQRLMRALELLQSTHRTMKELQVKKKREHPFEVIKVGLTAPRNLLYEQIDSRMDTMIASGLFEEAEKFFPQRSLNALQTVGYSEIFGYFEGLYDYNEAIRLLKRNSRRYAKRQLTWFLRDKGITWFESGKEAAEWLASTLVEQ